MSKVYQSEAYVEYATQNAEQAESYFGLGETTTTDDESDDTNITAWGDDIKAVVENLLASSPIRGDKDARFTIVEYTELHLSSGIRKSFRSLSCRNGWINQHS